MIFITKLTKSSILTYINIAIGVIGIYLASINLRVALSCLVLCTVFDLFDGFVARSIKNRSDFDKKFGIIIDSLGDVLMFSALPSIILFNVLGFSIFSIPVAIIYVACGITRLSVFTAEAKPGIKAPYYRGLPITFAGVIIPLAYTYAALLPFSIARIFLCVVYLLLSLFFVLNIKVSKP